MKVLKIKNTQYNLDALQGYSSARLTKMGVPNEHLEKLEPYLVYKKKVKKK